jgi:hypothetical protein
VEPNPLQKEFAWFLAHQDELVKKYNGRFVVIKSEAVIADFADEASAVFETQKSHPLGTFLVQKVEPGTASYTQTFHSRVA